MAQFALRLRFASHRFSVIQKLKVTGYNVRMRPLAIARRILGTGLYILSIDSPGLQARLRVLRKRSPAFDRIMAVFERKGKRRDDDPA